MSYVYDFTPANIRKQTHISIAVYSYPIIAPSIVLKAAIPHC